MLKFKEKLPPEIQVENVMSYTAQAAEVLKESPIELNKGSYRFMLLPDGPHYYTGILQTMGYLLINKVFSNTKNLIIFNDEDAKDKLYILEEEFSYLGKIREETDIFGKLSKKFPIIKTIKTKKDKKNSEKPEKQNEITKKILKNLKKKIQDQLIYIRVLNPQHNFSRGAIGPNCSIKKLNEILTDPKLKDYNIIFVGALHNKIGNTKCMNKDKELISQLLLGEKISDYKKEFPHIYYFAKASKAHIDNTEILAYLNSSQLGAEKNNCTGYACIIA